MRIIISVLIVFYRKKKPGNSNSASVTVRNEGNNLNDPDKSNITIRFSFTKDVIYDVFIWFLFIFSYGRKSEILSKIHQYC